jgi:hypothetical protein
VAGPPPARVRAVPAGAARARRAAEQDQADRAHPHRRAAARAPGRGGGAHGASIAPPTRPRYRPCRIRGRLPSVHPAGAGLRLPSVHSGPGPGRGGQAAAGHGAPRWRPVGRPRRAAGRIRSSPARPPYRAAPNRAEPARVQTGTGTALQRGPLRGSPPHPVATDRGEARPLPSVRSPPTATVRGLRGLGPTRPCRGLCAASVWLAVPGAARARGVARARARGHVAGAVPSGCGLGLGGGPAVAVAAVVQPTWGTSTMGTSTVGTAIVGTGVVAAALAVQPGPPAPRRWPPWCNTMALHAMAQHGATVDLVHTRARSWGPCGAARASAPPRRSRLPGGAEACPMPRRGSTRPACQWLAGPGRRGPR